MKTYNIVISESQIFYTTVEVEATNEDDAATKALQLADAGEVHCDEFMHCTDQYEVPDIEEA